jgi:hypothetical protein
MCHRSKNSHWSLHSWWKQSPPAWSSCSPSSPRDVSCKESHTVSTSQPYKNVPITTDCSILFSICISWKANRMAALEMEHHSSREQTFPYMNHTAGQNISVLRLRKYPSKCLLKTLSLMTSMLVSLFLMTVQLESAQFRLCLFLVSSKWLPSKSCYHQHSVNISCLFYPSYISSHQIAVT